MYYYLYKITNLINNKIYIGVHKTSNLNDGYMGSGKIVKHAIEKYGIKNFKKEILQFFSDSESMLRCESEIVNEEFLSCMNVYNLKIGGSGGFDYILKNKLNITPESLKKRSESFKITRKQKYWNSNTPHTDETKKQISQKRKEFFAKGGKHPKGMLGKSHKEETKLHVSLILKEKGSLIGKKGLDHPVGGTKWYNNGEKHLRSETHPGDGWSEGRIFKERKKRSQK